MGQLAMLLITLWVVTMPIPYTSALLLEKSPHQKHHLVEPVQYFKEEGRDFLMECTSDDIKDTHVWTIVTSSGKKISVDCCGADDCERHRHLDSFVKVTCYLNDTKTHSRLRIGKITHAHRDSSIECRALKNGNPSSAIQLRSVRLTTYHKPRNPRCQVLPTGENSHRVTCTAPGGYPEMTCNMTQYEEDHQRKTIIDRNFNYSYVKSDKNHDLLTTVCSIDLPYLKPGNYTYFTVFAPNLTTYVRNSSTPAPPTPTVQVQTSRRQVLIEHHVTGPHRLLITCRAYGFTNSSDVTISICIFSTCETFLHESADVDASYLLAKMFEPKASREELNVLCICSTSEFEVSNMTYVNKTNLDLLYPEFPDTTTTYIAVVTVLIIVGLFVCSLAVVRAVCLHKIRQKNKYGKNLNQNIEYVKVSEK